MGESKPMDETEMAADRVLPDGRILPDDFDAEDAALARTLNSVYHIQREYLPPCYAQTLLGYPQYAPASDEFVERVTNSVFERLDLTRRFAMPAPVVRRRIKPQERARPRKNGMMTGMLRQGMVAVMALLVLFSFEALFTSTAFADMMRFLIVGHSGVQAVANYPAITRTSTPVPNKNKPQGDHRILFIPQWAGENILGYSFVGTTVMDKQWWSDNAIISLNYEKRDASGVHHLNILEFHVSSQAVLQVVQDGSSQNIAVGASSAIVIDGHWVQRKPPAAPIWVTDQRAKLIFSDPEDPELVTWIATDDVAGYSQSDVQQRLTTVAQTLKDMNFTDIQRHAGQMQYIGDQPSLDILRSFGGDVIAVLPSTSQSGGAAVYVQIGPPSDQDNMQAMPNGTLSN
ncbi:MAG TPA: hypothetical protein VKB76_13420 [Ktedonobacterales bacterium]|nr:hypothetical protein [Ktedonobacterales bacterium]